MKPIRTFSFLAAVLLSLFALAWVFPREGIPLGQDYQLNFADPTGLFDRNRLDEKNPAEELLAAFTVSDDPEAFLPESQQPEDTLPHFRAANTDSLKQHMTRISLPEGEEELLNPFFSRLEAMQSGQNSQVRILHFGDSQIEVDRMTALIRYRLQKVFGGSGMGLVHAIPLFNRSLSYEQEESGAWTRYTFFGKRDSSIRHRSYGIMAAYAAVPLAKEGDWPQLNYHFHTARRSGQVDRVRIFLHSYTDGAMLALRVNANFQDTLGPLDAGFNVADFRHHEQIEALELAMNLPEGGRIYGISFESNEGLHMDNIPMRGSSGLIFNKMDPLVQQSMLEHLSPDLILLQYGGNVVPYMNPGNYKRGFLRQLAFFKASCPEVPLIVIGPSDMARKENGKFSTYPRLEAIRDAMKEAALESGYAFWDLYEAMGGQNSMASFVHSEPPLAVSDYVHFTALGINLVGELFHQALMLEYQSYQEKSQEPL